jgi:glycosyltransferase involved in cell wall biosynthesis
MRSLKLWLKRLLISPAAIIAISRAVAEAYNSPCTTLGNPYDDTIFRIDSSAVRNRDLIFAGRLVSDKGAAEAIQALSILRGRGLRPTLSIVGDGPEKPSLQALASQLGVNDQITFHGTKSYHQLASLLNRHNIIVVPSRWPEPFGIVALEGIACGCVAVASEGGGLPEAIGPCGITFPNGNIEALADCLSSLIGDPARLASYRGLAAAHLAKYAPRSIAQRYLEAFSAVGARSRTSKLTLGKAAKSTG